MSGFTLIVLFLAMLLGAQMLQIPSDDMAIVSIIILIVLWSIDYFTNYVEKFYSKRLVLLLLNILLTLFAFVSGWTLGQGRTALSPLVVGLGFLCFVAWLGSLAHLVRRRPS